MVSIGKADCHKTIKMPGEILQTVKDDAHLISMSDSRFILLAVVAILDMIRKPGAEEIPMLVFLIQQARSYQGVPIAARQGSPVAAKKGVDLG